METKSNTPENLDDFIYKKCKDAYNCEEYIATHLQLTYDKLAVFSSLDLLVNDDLPTFLNHIFGIFLVAIEHLPEEQKPLHGLSKSENPEEMIVYLKSHQNWECIELKDQNAISDKFTQKVMWPILIECIRVWTIAFTTLESPQEMQKYILCGVVLNKYLVIMEKTKESVAS